MGLRFPNALLTVVFQIQRQSETLDIHTSKVYSLECNGHGSSHWMEDFGCTRPLEHSNTFFTTRKLTQKHLYLGMSFKSLALYSKMVLKPLFSIALDLENHGNRCMHPMRSRTWEHSNLRLSTRGLSSFLIQSQNSIDMIPQGGKFFIGLTFRLQSKIGSLMLLYCHQ